MREAIELQEHIVEKLKTRISAYAEQKEILNARLEEQRQTQSAIAALQYSLDNHAQELSAYVSAERPYLAVVVGERAFLIQHNGTDEATIEEIVTVGGPS